MGAAGGNVQLTGQTDVETCPEKEDRGVQLVIGGPGVRGAR